MAEIEMREATDSKGRKLKFHELSLMQEMDLTEAAGPLSENTRWLGMARIAAMVCEIDGIPCPFPTNKLQIRAALNRLDTEGLEAVAASFAPVESGEQEQASQHSLDMAKNLVAAP